MAEIDTQFSDFITALRERHDKAAYSRRCLLQPVWLNFSEDETSRLKLLEKIDRVDLNEKFKQAIEHGDETNVGELNAMAVQHDFLAAAARDLFHVRRGRLYRFHAKTATERGLGGAYGVINGTVLGYVQKLVRSAR